MTSDEPLMAYLITLEVSIRAQLAALEKQMAAVQVLRQRLERDAARSGQAL